MKQLVWISLAIVSITGCATTTGDEPPGEQLGVVEQQLSVALSCAEPGEPFATGPCILTRPSATMPVMFQVFHSENPPNPLRYFWEVPGLQITSGCKDTQSWCALQAGNACSDRELTMGVQVVDTVTGESFVTSTVLFIPAVCFEFGRAVLC